MKTIKTNDALKANGHYSQAVVHNGTVYCSGILPFDSNTGEYVDGSVEEQCKAVFTNLEHILAAAGTSKDKVLKTTIYIPNINLWPLINDLYSAFFGDNKPARSIVPTNTLHFNSNIELECIAYID